MASQGCFPRCSKKQGTPQQPHRAGTTTLGSHQQLHLLHLKNKSGVAKEGQRGHREHGCVRGQLGT